MLDTQCLSLMSRHNIHLERCKHLIVSKWQEDRTVTSIAGDLNIIVI